MSAVPAEAAVLLAILHLEDDQVRQLLGKLGAPYGLEFAAHKVRLLSKSDSTPVWMIQQSCKSTKVVWRSSASVFTECRLLKMICKRCAQMCGTTVVMTLLYVRNGVYCALVYHWVGHGCEPCIPPWLEAKP